MQASQSVAAATLSIEKPRNYTIDVLRLIGAFCVVALHCPLGTLPNALALGIRLGSRWAVPYFFLVSGYFIAQSLRPNQPLNCSKSLNNLLAIAIVANSIYGLFFLLDADPITSFQFTFTGLLIGQYHHLWYIGATIFGLLFLQYFASRYSDKVLLFVALGTLVAILAGYNYAALTGWHVQQEIARYATSIPFLFGGFLLARHSGVLRHISLGTCLAIALAGLILESGEAVALYKLAAGISPHNQELVVGTAVLAVGLFCLSLKLQTPAPTLLAVAGKNYSLLIYLYHPLVVFTLYSLLKLGNYSAYYFWFSPLIVFSIILLLVSLIHRVSPALFRLLSGNY